MAEFDVIMKQLKSAFDYKVLIAKHPKPMIFVSNDYKFKIQKIIEDGRIDYDILYMYSIKEGVEFTLTLDLMRKCKDILIHHKTVI